MVLILIAIATAIVLAIVFPNGKRHNTMKRKLPDVFDSWYLDLLNLYRFLYNEIPSKALISGVDPIAVFAFISEDLGENVVHTHQVNTLNRDTGKLQFDQTIFCMDNAMIVDLDGENVEIYYPARAYADLVLLTAKLGAFKVVKKKQPFEVNIITTSRDGLRLKPMKIRKTELDLERFYNDDFRQVDAILKQRLNQHNDKGIVLLHGLPGTGKTTYLRYLVGTLNKRVLFVSPSVAENLTDPLFMDLLIENPNAVLVIEDAENILKDRKLDSRSSVSNLLNLSDGLLSDCVNVQVICTFNCSLALIDPALMRKGRLIARYEFGKLSLEKSQILSDSLGHQSLIDEPMTLAEISTQHEQTFETKRIEVVGFRMN